jgi:hypothetical protein
LLILSGSFLSIIPGQSIHFIYAGIILLVSTGVLVILRRKWNRRITCNSEVYASLLLILISLGIILGLTGALRAVFDDILRPPISMANVSEREGESSELDIYDASSNENWTSLPNIVYNSSIGWNGSQQIGQTAWLNITPNNDTDGATYFLNLFDTIQIADSGYVDANDEMYLEMVEFAIGINDITQHSADLYESSTGTGDARPLSTMNNEEVKHLIDLLELRSGMRKQMELFSKLLRGRC